MSFKHEKDDCAAVEIDEQVPLRCLNDAGGFEGGID